MQERSGTLALLLLVLSLLTGFPSEAEKRRQAQTPEEAYDAALHAVERAAESQALEPLYSQGLAAVRQVTPRIAAYATKNWEKKGYDPQRQFAPLMKKLQGFSIAVSEGDAIAVRPRFAFWKELSARTGRPEDQRFFTLSLQLFPDHSNFAVYITQQWDYGGCTRYGEGLLVGLYRDWKDYQRRFPNSYTEAVKQNVDAVERALNVDPNGSICSCSGKAGFIKELTDFVKTLPTDPLSPKLNQILATLLTPSSRFRFECHNG